MDGAGPEVERLIETGFVVAFETREQLHLRRAATTQLGGRRAPPISKLGVIIEEKDGKTICRLILDCKAKGANNETKCLRGLTLPGFSDAVDDPLYLMSECDTSRDESLHFSDRFENVPLHPFECKYFMWAYISSFQNPGSRQPERTAAVWPPG